MEGRIVTVDLFRCQRETARQFVEKGGDYLLQIKGNQAKLQELAQRQIDASPFLRKLTAGTDA